MSLPKWHVWGPLAIVVIVFGRAVGFPFVEWDDAKYILQNPLIAGGLASEPLDWLMTPQLGYVVPVTVAVERALFLIGAGEAWPFHLFAVVLHAGNAWLLAKIAGELGVGPKTAAIAALGWALHPMVAEPVNWATGLKDVLALAFVLGCALAVLRDRSALAIVLGTLAFATKPTTVLLPLALLVWKRERWKTVVALGVIAALFAVLSGTMRAVQIADRFGGVIGAANAFEVLVAQVENYLAPMPLHPVYSVDRGVWRTIEGIGVAIAFAALLFAVRRKPGPRFVLALAAALYLPSSQLVPFPRTMADSFLYAPMAALWIGVALAPWRRRQQLFPGAVLVLAVLALLSCRQSSRWRSNESLWLPLIQDDPGWAYPCVLLAQGYMMEGRPASAARLYEQAMARQYAPQYLSAMGEALYAAGRVADAQCVLEEDLLFGVVDAARARRNLERLQKLPGIDASRVAFTPDGRAPRSCSALRRTVERVGVAEAGK